MFDGKRGPPPANTANNMRYGAKLERAFLMRYRFAA
jgi:hypothetical protein